MDYFNFSNKINELHSNIYRDQPNYIKNNNHYEKIKERISPSKYTPEIYYMKNEFIHSRISPQLGNDRSMHEACFNNEKGFDNEDDDNISGPFNFRQMLRPTNGPTESLRKRKGRHPISVWNNNPSNEIYIKPSGMNIPNKRKPNIHNHYP